MTYLKEESFLDINKKEIRYESKSIIKETYAGMQKSLDEMAVCMLLTRKILSINNVKDNLLFLQKNNLVYGYKNSWCRFASE